MAKAGKNATRSGKYTIVELAVVLLILAIFLSMSMPALNSLAQGRAVDTAARTIQSQLRQARMFAITSRQYVAVLFPTESQADWGADFPYSAFRNCIVGKDKKQISTTYGGKTIVQWPAGTKWEFTPAGAVVGYVSKAETGGSGASDLCNNDKAELVDDTFKGNCRAVIFKPTGLSDTRGVYITEGMNAPKVATSNVIHIKIDQFSGKANIQPFK